MRAQLDEEFCCGLYSSLLVIPKANGGITRACFEEFILESAIDITKRSIVGNLFADIKLNQQEFTIYTNWSDDGNDLAGMVEGGDDANQSFDKTHIMSFQ